MEEHTRSEIDDFYGSVRVGLNHNVFWLEVGVGDVELMQLIQADQDLPRDYLQVSQVGENLSVHLISMQ